VDALGGSASKLSSRDASEDWAKVLEGWQRAEQRKAWECSRQRCVERSCCSCTGTSASARSRALFFIPSLDRSLFPHPSLPPSQWTSLPICLIEEFRGVVSPVLLLPVLPSMRYSIVLRRPQHPSPNHDRRHGLFVKGAIALRVHSHLLVVSLNK
jgi:hypothetical protein